MRALIGWIACMILRLAEDECLLQAEAKGEVLAFDENVPLCEIIEQLAGWIRSGTLSRIVAAEAVLASGARLTHLGATDWVGREVRCLGFTRRSDYGHGGHCGMVTTPSTVYRPPASGARRWSRRPARRGGESPAPPINPDAASPRAAQPRPRRQ